MRITIAALGTRGDVQPMVALGKGLQAAGHSVCIIGGSNFDSWVRSHGLDFVPTVNIEAIMNSEQGKTWSESSENQMAQLRAMKSLLNEHGDGMAKPMIESAQYSDVFIAGFVAEPFIQSISEKMRVPYLTTLLQPYRPTTSGAATLITPLPKANIIINRWFGTLGERIIWGLSSEYINKMRVELLGLPPTNAGTYNRLSRAVPTLLGVSKYVVPPATDWHSNTRVGGYWFLDEEAGWQPSAELTRFLDAGDPPVYIGFGSMSNRNPERTLALIFDALRATGQRGVIASGWSGAQAEQLPDGVFLLDHAPHTWLFPRMSAVVHHGGAGTTAAGLRAGKPAMVIPHMSDQPYWARRVHELGVGVKPVPRHKLTAEILADGLRQMASDSQMRANAAALGEKIRAEQGVRDSVAIIDAWVREIVPQRALS